MSNKSLATAFILGLLVSAMFGLAVYTEQEQGAEESVTLQNRQVLLDGKVHLIEMKMDVIAEQKDQEELQNDFDQIMQVLEQSHQYTGEGLIARDEAMRAAAAQINDAIAAGGQNLIEAIEELIAALEDNLHIHEEVED